MGVEILDRGGEPPTVPSSIRPAGPIDGGGPPALCNAHRAAACGITRVCFVELGPGHGGRCRWESPLPATAQVPSSKRNPLAMATCCDRLAG